MQVQELVGIVPWNFIATICNLFIQVYLIKRFLFKPVNEMLEQAQGQSRCRDSGCCEGEGRGRGYESRIRKEYAGSKDKANDIVLDRSENSGCSE